MDIETRKSRLLKRCKYYKGEKECPFEKEMTFWGWQCEEFWVRCLLKNDTAPLDSAVAFYRKLVDLSDPSLQDGTPIAVQTLLFERFCHNSDTDPLFLADYFPGFYVRYFKNNNCDHSSPETRR